MHNNIRVFRKLIVSFAIFVATAGGPAFSQENGFASAHELLLGIDNARSKISTGVVRVSGTTIQQKDGKVISRSDDQCFIAFDYDSGCYRFERGGDKIFLQTPKAYYERWSDLPGSSQAAITQYEIHAPPIARVNPFDIRNLGFFTCYGLYYRSRYDDFRSYLLGDTKVLESSDDGALSFVSVIKRNADEKELDRFVNYKIWVDRDQGYTTTRIEANSFCVSDMSWEVVNGVHVPVSFRQEYNSSSSGLKITVEWAFDWESVNEDVPDELFTYQSLKRKQDDSAVLYSPNVAPDGSPVAIDKFGAINTDPHDVPGR